MRFDVTKIDDRIRKLQQLRRMVLDAEMAQILMDTLTEADPPQATAAPGEGVDGNVEPAIQGADLVIQEVLQSTGADSTNPSGPFWTRRS